MVAESMKWIHVLFSVISVSFILFCGSLINSKNASALVPNRMASSAVINISSNSPNWHTVVKNHNSALPIIMLTGSETGNTLEVSRFDVSAFVNPTQTGQYWNGSFTLTVRFAYNHPGLVPSHYINCNRITEARLKPEQGTVVSQSYKIQSCSADYWIASGGTSPSAIDLKLKVQASGKLSQSTTVSSYVLQIISSNDAPFFIGNLPTVPDEWSMIIPANGLDINFNLNTDPNTTGQGDINQNITEIGDKIEDLNNSITDPTVNGNFQTNNVPAFGPVATIVNNIFDLPRVFINPGQCQAVNLPLPFVNKNLPLTCPSDFMAPYQQIIVLVDTIASAYILYKTAVYTVKSVKKLRDPENEDEEYLDL